MRIGIANEETWDFFHEIYDELREHHQVDLFERKENRLPFFKERINSYLFQRQMERLLLDNDVVFFEWASHLLAAATQFPKTCGIVTRLHRYEMYQWVDKINWDAVDKIILVSEAKRREFIDLFPDQASKVIVIYEAVDPSQYQFSPKAFAGNIGILCHLTPRKRVYELILAFNELVDAREGLHLHIAGGPPVSFGDYYSALQHIVSDLGLEEQVTFYGSVEEPANWYSQIDIFISNSYSEGLQVALLEAMASGCFCLAHRWDGAEEALPEEYLYYSDSELQQRILTYCSNSEADKKQIMAGMRNIVSEKFNIDKSKAAVRKIVEEAANF